MGSRAQVKIEDTGVFLYTHWGADEIEEDVRTVIRRGKRLNDPEYLARIIFDQMTLGQQGQETGAGIGTQEAGDIEVLVTVSCQRKTVTVKDVYKRTSKTLTFEDFTKGEPS
jgi:hypothetical protein